MECPVCLTGYDETVRRPRSMPCGHTICSTCIDGIVDKGHATCPTCRISNAVPKGGQFPVNYIVEDLLWRLKDSSSAAAAVAATAAATDCQLEPPCRSGKISSLLQQQEAKVLTAISTCQDVQAQLGKFQTTLADWCQQQQHLENSLQTVIDESRSARVLVQQNELKVAAKNEVVKTGEQKLNAALEALRKINSPQAAYLAIDNADKCTDKEEQSTKETQGMLLEVADVTADAAKKMTEALHVVLEATQRVQATHETVARAALKPNPTPARERGIEGLTEPPTLCARDLRKQREGVKKLLEDGKAFAVQSVDNVKKYSRMSISGYRVFLHALQDLSLPLGAAIVEMDQVVPDYPSWKVFLDISRPGSPSQRVEISLSLKSHLGQQFKCLCTGEKGHSFLNSRLFMVQDKGQPGETVCGGKLECDGVMKDIPMLVTVDDSGVYSKSGKAGAVRGWEGGALFAITTRDTLCGEFEMVFGEVVLGLDALMAAAQRSNITEVTVVDCGVVLFE
ncbi:uncharacterized protein LOC127008518 isoform X2 [Eriocheir sinensis]|uniref:uncharacterized protein LOC127008518 isoform X2 n=1 Tax=Eriocheir sinensis TaxID=95602 RepID=UPI0021C593F3|nr:uncharacterized protein LOC127008518 isoform X2 [Eriocheir sinensis]